MKQFLRYRLERLLVWALERCLAQFIFVIGSEVCKLNAKADQFESEVKQGSDVFTSALVNLDARLKALETREVTKCE